METTLRHQNFMLAIRCEMGWPSFKPANDCIAFCSGRAEWYARASAAVRLSRASAYCAVSEAWMATAKRAGDPAAALAPSERSDRQEVVTTVCVGRAGDRASSVKAIRRDPVTAKVVALVDLDGLDMADGDLFRLFDW